MPSRNRTSHRGKGLSSFFSWDTSKVNPVLWFYLLFLNALYTVIGVRLRDLQPNGACELNINRTIGRFEYFDRAGLFWGLWSIYPIISIVIVLVQIVFHVLYCCKDDKTKQRQQQGHQGEHVDQSDPEGLRDQVDESDLEDRRDQGVQVDLRVQGGRRDQGTQVDQRDLGGQRDQGGLKEKQKVQRLQNVVEILHIVLVNSLVIISGSLYIAADNFFFLVDPDHETHNPSTTRSFIAGSSFICSVLVLVVTQWFEQSVYKCLETFDCVEGTNNKPDENEEGENNLKKCLKILYFWSPLAGLITMFDSLFISIVHEISGEDNVRSGFDCSNERGVEGAIILYIAICIVFSTSIVVIVVFKMINKRKHMGKYSSFEWKWCWVHFSYIAYFLVMGIVFIITGLIFMVVDNNWPWICLAKHDRDICYWVMIRVGFLAVITVISILLLLSSATLSLLEYCEELCGKSKPVETTNESAIDRGGAANEQMNTAASGTEMQAPNRDEENIEMDDTLTVRPVESGTFPEADSEC